MARVLVRQPSGPFFENPQQRFDSSEAAHQAADQQHEESRVRNQEAGLVLLPRETDQCGAEDVQAQQAQQGRKPPRPVDPKVNRLGPVSVLHERGPAQNHGGKENHHHGEPQ